MKKRLLVFTAPWCIPCKKYIPVVQEVVESYFPDLPVDLIDIGEDEHVETARFFNVKSVPTIIMLDEKTGFPVAQKLDIMNRDDLADWVKAGIEA